MLRPRVPTDPLFCHLCDDLERASYVIDGTPVMVGVCASCVALLCLDLRQISVRDLTALSVAS